ncbi:protein red1 [Podospora conica]|nr:protein red1 [Schizothecium conicum]
MSQYPYGYGQQQGAPSTIPYGFQAPPHPAQSYNPSDQHASTSVNRNISNSAFDYNASNIPGLGIASSPPAASPYVPLWVSSAAQAPPQHPRPFATGASSAPSQGGAYGSSRPHAPGPPSQPAALQTQTTYNDVEEGELSEGQFEDLYEPRDIVEPQPASKPITKPSSAVSLSGSNSAVDTPEAGFYGNDDDDGGVPPPGNNASAEARERSGSYSPFLSPREIRSENTTPQAVVGSWAKPPPFPFGASIPPAKPPTVGNHRGPPFQRGPAVTNAVVPGLHITPSQAPKVPPNGNNTKPRPLASQGPSRSSGPFSSVLEAKKEAQKAILALLPMGVKYQTYLDEGFDKDVIKSLFQGLHLDMPKSPTSTPKDLPQPVKPSQDKISLAKSAPTSKVQSDSGPNAASKPDRAGEERKDKIARLLAAKAAKAPPAPAPPQPAVSAPPQPQQPSPPTVPAKTKVWGEKELLLKQKMAALQKSREAQKPTPGPGTNTGASPASQVHTQQKTALPNLDVSRPDKQSSTPQTGAIPGILLSGNQSGQVASQRKRPVAADFVEYSSTVGPLKRPFGQDRKETSLIIDISDGSDDEEVDMDMGSPVDETTTLRGGPFAQPGPAIRDFPPLTDGLPNRQFSSPAQLSQTPPGGSILTRRRETELDLKEREIQEMRRKIAEAEAKRKAKLPSVDSQTTKKGKGAANQTSSEVARPPLGRRAPSSSDGPSAQLMLEASSVKLPKLSERTASSQSPRAEFKSRIVSQDLPRIKESIEEKRMRLKQLQEEQERLKAELDQQFAEEKLLTEQLEEIEGQTSGGDSQPNGMSSNDDFGEFPKLLRPSSSNSPTSAGHVSANESHAVPSAVASAHATTSASPEESDDDISMDEDPSSRENSVEQDDVMQDAADDADAAGATSDIATTVPPSTAADQHPSPATHSEEDPATTSPEHATGRTEPESTASTDHGPESSTVPAQSNAVQADETSPMEIESSSQSSPSQSPVPAESASGQTPTDEESRDQSRRKSSSPLLISDVAEPREINQEIEQGVVREVNDSSPKQERPFAPYETPLRYFHAYRYHPFYSKTIAGGLRSLTYSNRIDPKTPLCPDELSGQQCAQGCQFQHFASLTPPEDQILVELGRSDDFAGEQKNRFIQGLREVLQGFRANKVKDFDAIARGIIEYRSRFLGDKSRVLHLEGVSI